MKVDLTSSLSKLAYKIHPKLGELYDWQPSYWNYAFVGGFGVLINWFIFLLLRPFLFDLAWWIGVLVAWNFNYGLSKIWVFKNEGRGVTKKA